MDEHRVSANKQPPSKVRVGGAESPQEPTGFEQLGQLAYDAYHGHGEPETLPHGTPVPVGVV